MLRVRERWRQQREGDRDTHVGFSEILFSRSRKPFWGKMRKKIKGAKPRPRRNYKFCMEDEKCQDHAPSRPPPSFKGLSPDWGDFITGHSSPRERRAELRWTRHFNEIKRRQNAENVLWKREKRTGNHRACQFNSFLNSKSSFLAFGQNNLQYLRGYQEKESKENLAKKSGSKEVEHGVFGYASKHEINMGYGSIQMQIPIRC